MRIEDTIQIQQTTSLLAAVLGEGPKTVEGSRQFWVCESYNEPSVFEVTGYDRNSSSEGAWWCPKWGYTGFYKHSLWDTKEEAVNSAIERHEKTIAKLRKLLTDPTE